MPCGRYALRALATVGLLLTLALPASALGSAATARHGVLPPSFPIPASARVHGTTSTTPASTTPASTSPASTTPASATPANTTPASAATTPAGSAGATTTPVGGSTTPTTVPTPAAAAPSATAPAAPITTLPAHTPAAKTAASPTKLSTAAIVVAALAALLIVVCLAWGAARWWAYEPRWTVSLRHCLAEASWRLSTSWDEFSDWVRLGR